MNIKTLLFAGAMLCVATGAQAQSSLVGLYTFNNAASLGQDSSGKGNNLIAYGNGAAYTANGASGGGLLLDGRSYLSTTDQLAPTLFPVGGSAYTLSVTFSTTSTSPYQAFLGWGAYGNTDRVNALRVDGNSAFYNYWWAADIRGSTNGTIADGRFHTLTANYDGAVRNLYYDGTLIASDRPGAPNVQRGNFAIGLADAFNGQPYLADEHFTGTLDNVAIFNTAQTPDQVAAAITAASAVPEPATWAMMTVGFGLVGTGLRRRAKVRTNVSFG